MEWKQTRRRGIDRREELGAEKEGWEEGRRKTGGKRGWRRWKRGGVETDTKEEGHRQT